MLWARVQTLRSRLSWEAGGARCLSPVPLKLTLILNSVGNEEFALVLLQSVHHLHLQPIECPRYHHLFLIDWFKGIQKNGRML